MPPLVGAYRIPALGRAAQRAPERIAESIIDHDPEGLAAAQGVAGLAVGGKAPFDTGGVEQDREAAVVSAP